MGPTQATNLGSIRLVARSFDAYDRIVIAILVAFFAAMAGAAAVNGLMTGAIDGPARGGDLVAYAKNPQLFVLLACMYSAICLSGVALAIMLVKHRNDL